MSDSLKFRVTIVVGAIALVTLSGQALAINKCVTPSGEVSFSDSPCDSGSKAKTIEIETGQQAAQPTKVPPSEVQSMSTEVDREHYCSQEDSEEMTPEERIARLKAFVGANKGSAEVCCLNGKVVPCDEQNKPK